MFFGKNKQSAWTFEGFHAWQRLQDIGMHEKTEGRINASVIIKIKMMAIVKHGMNKTKITLTLR